MKKHHRENLLVIYQAAINGVNGRHAVQHYLTSHPLHGDAPYYLIAIGKAAASMAEGAFDLLGSRIVRALVITRYGYADHFNSDDDSIELIAAGHPQPDENSLRAGTHLLALLADALQEIRDVQFIFLISGGTSALVEQLPSSIALDELQRINRWLLGSGLAINEINQIRTALSLIKGGRLIRHLNGRATLNLLMSDVPGDDLAVIGSGLLTAQQHGCSTALSDKIPEWLQRHLEVATGGQNKFELESGVGTDAQIKTVIVAAAKDARSAAATAAETLGYRVHCHERFIDGDAVMAGEQLIAELNNSEAGIHIWSSETTVQLPEKPGQGGRCQQLALAAARQISTDIGWVMLVAGTDGSDGGINQQAVDAGAMVDGGTLQRGESEGFNIGDALMQANAGAFLEASGDLISTGPTGANVMDLIIVYVPQR